jgi:hypothetical protein
LTLSRLSYACAAGAIAFAVGPASGADFNAAIFQGTVAPLAAPFQVVVRPGWRARCRARAGDSEIVIEKTTVGTDGTVLNAQIRNVPRSIGSVSTYAVALFFGQGGQPADVQVEEVAGHPIDDEAYVALRDSAVSMVPEAEFAGKMSHDIAQQRRNEPSQDAAGQVAVDAAISVAGIETVGDEAYLVIRREGRMSGTLGGQDVSILFAGFTRLHQASGLIAEQVLETELRSQGTNPVRDRRHLICTIEPIG